MESAFARCGAEDDGAVVERIRAGDERAFTNFFQRFSPYVAGVACRLLGSDAEVDDIVQETFVSAAEHIDSLRNGESARYWLATIAVRHVHRRLRQRKRRRRLINAWRVSAPRFSDPEVGERARALYEALDTLPDKFRVPWILCRIEKEGLGRVAEMCRISLATTKRRVARADELLERRLRAG